MPMHRGRWLLAVLLGGQTMATLDGAILNIALPSIGRDLHASGAALQLSAGGYLLAYAVLLVAGARLGDSRGHRTLFVGGLALFTATSLVCGAATAMWMLVAARVLQGAAAACMVPQVLSLIQRSFEGAERRRALSLYSAVLSLGVAAGQVLGGLLVSADLAGSSWRAVFFVNVPVGVALLVVAWRQLPTSSAGARRFDVAGMLVLAAGMVLLVVPLTLGRELGWPAWSLACLALSALVLAAFGLVERAVGRMGPEGEALVDVGLLGDRVVALGLVAIAAVMAAFAAFAFTFTLYVQTELGFSPLRSSLTFLPYAVGFGTASLTWTRLPARWHGRVSPLGFVLMACGLALLAVAMAGGVRPPVVVPLQFAAGAGHALAFAPLAVAVTARVRPTQAASLSGMLSTGTTLAAVVGVALGGGAYLSAAAAGGSTFGFQFVLAGLAAAMLASATAAAGAVAAAQAGSPMPRREWPTWRAAGDD